MTPKTLLAPARLAGLPLLRSQSDERLVDLVRAGNDAAFEAIVARYRRPLLRHAGRMLSEGRAEDVVQQAFERALRALRADERSIDLKPWLYTIVVNASLNALRERSVPSDTLEEEIDGVERPEQAFERRQRMRDVVAAVGALPERQRDALVLRELEGRSYDEIAAKLGVSEGSVRQLLNRARNTLRAGVTAVTPVGLLLRIGTEEPVMARIAELTAGAGTGAVAAKAPTTALVTGAVVGGVAAGPAERDSAQARPGPAPAEARGSGERSGGLAAKSSRAGRRAGSGGSSAATGAAAKGGRHAGRSGAADAAERSGPGDDFDGDSSGPGSGDSFGADSSGPGSGGDLSEPGSGLDSSGSGSSGSGSSGSGSSGTGPSGSGSSGSGSGSSGSGSGGEEDRSGSNSGSG